MDLFYKLREADWESSATSNNEPVAWEFKLQVAVKDKLWMLADAYLERVTQPKFMGERNKYVYRLDIPYTAATRNLVFTSRDAALNYVNNFCLLKAGRQML